MPVLLIRVLCLHEENVKMRRKMKEEGLHAEGGEEHHAWECQVVALNVARRALCAELFHVYLPLVRNKRSQWPTAAERFVDVG